MAGIRKGEVSLGRQTGIKINKEQTGGIEHRAANGFEDDAVVQ
jgi:hypothetical protein